MLSSRFRLKSYNAVLLLLLYIVVFFCFELVIKDLHIFKKVNLSYELNYLKLGVSTSVVLVNVLLLVIFKAKDFLYSISVLILIFFVFPSAILFNYINGVDYRIFLSHNLFFLFIFFIGKIRLKFFFKKIEIKQSVKLLTFIVVVGIVPFIILYSPHLNLKNLLLSEIYVTRALMAENISNIYTDYTYSWFNKFIIPCLLVFALYLKNRTTIIICTFSLIFLYLCGAHKAVFIGLIFTFLLYRYDYLKKINYLIKVVIVIALFSIVTSVFFNNDFLMNISIRRAVLLPGLLDVLYFDFFENDYMYWSESLNGLFREYPFDYEHSYIIGKRYFNDITWGANNGIVSDGFMNLGMIGVFINILFVSIYVSVLNQLDISPKFFGLFFLFIILVLSASLTTIMVTHGGVILMLLSFFVMKNTNEQMV
jgi:hypothetical protein